MFDLGEIGKLFGGGASKDGDAPGGMMGGGMGKMLMNLVGGPEGIKKMIMGQIDNPEMRQMAEEKGVEIFQFIATRYNCTKKEIGFYWQLADVPVKDAAGNIQMDESGKQKTVEKMYMMIMINGHAKEKMSVEQLMSLVKENLKETDLTPPPTN